MSKLIGTFAISNNKKIYNMKKILLICTLIAFASCTKKKECEAAGNNEEKALQSMNYWQEQYFANPNTTNKNQYTMAKQDYEQSVKIRNSYCK
jgi:hypothetical protein